MKFVNVIQQGSNCLGVQSGEKILCVSDAWAQEHDFPTSMEDLITRGVDGLNYLKLQWDEMNQVDGSTGVWYTEHDVEFAPSVVQGRKIICIGLNYLKHVQESRLEIPKVPLLFGKFDNTLAGHNATVVRPAQTRQLDYEAEVAVVIGRQARNISEQEALNYVLGYCVANDLSARDMQFLTSQWLLGKTYDGFCPIGPALVTADEVLNPQNLNIRCIVNGEVRQSANTEQMIFSFAELISYISHQFTLEPGDVILSGTPDGVVLGKPEAERVWLQPGDEVIVEVDGLGRLRTIVG